MKTYPNISDILNTENFSESISKENEAELIADAENMALEIETNEAQAYLTAATIILNC